MGARGPIPKRSEARSRNNKTGEDGIALRKGTALPYEFPDADEDWHQWTKDFYDSFRTTGMTAYFQATDVAALQLACRLLDREVVNKGRPSAMFMAECMKMLDGLGITEGERRRIKIELEPEREEGPDLKVVAMEDAKARLKHAAGGAK